MVKTTERSLRRKGPFKKTDKTTSSIAKGKSAKDPVKIIARALNEKVLTKSQYESFLNALQTTHGNRFVQRALSSGVIQHKLVISKPGDVYEQEADRLADKIIQRQPEPEEEEGLMPKSITDEFLQKQEPEEKKKEEEVLAKSEKKKSSMVTKDIEERLDQTAGKGKPLPKDTQEHMGSQLGYDFSEVKVHADSESADLARSLRAQAFTRGKDIYFDSGKYDTSSKEGKKLIAHELTHVMQQRKGHGLTRLMQQRKDNSDKETELPPLEPIPLTRPRRVEAILKDLRGKPLRDFWGIDFMISWKDGSAVITDAKIVKNKAIKKGVILPLSGEVEVNVDVHTTNGILSGIEKIKLPKKGPLRLRLKQIGKKDLKITRIKG